MLPRNMRKHLDNLLLEGKVVFVYKRPIGNHWKYSVWPLNVKVYRLFAVLIPKLTNK